jgi:ABC-type amino acid transport substrate-binding protein
MNKSTAMAVLTIVLFFTASVLAALEGEIEPMPEDIVRIRQRGELCVAQFEGERPGFFSFVDGERLEAARKAGVSIYEYQGKFLVGHDIEMALALARELGVEMRIRRGYPAFSDTVAGVARGEADIAMTKLSKTVARAVTADLSRPYFQADITILLNRLQEQRLPLRDDVMDRLAAGTAVFGVIPTTSQKEWTETVFPKAAVREYPDQNALFDAVNRGEVTAVLYEEFEAKRFFRLWPDIALNCRMTKHPYLADLMVFATRPGDEGLKRLVDAWLGRTRPLYTDDILDRYEPMMAKDSHREVRSALPKEETSAHDMAAFGVAALGVVLMAAWVFSARAPRR